MRVVDLTVELTDLATEITKYENTHTQDNKQLFQIIGQIHGAMLLNIDLFQGRNLGSTFWGGGVCSYNFRKIGRGLCIAQRKVQYYTWLLGG